MKTGSSLRQWGLDIPTFLEIYKCIRRHFLGAVSLSASCPVHCGFLHLHESSCPELSAMRSTRFKPWRRFRSPVFSMVLSGPLLIPTTLPYPGLDEPSANGIRRALCPGLGVLCPLRLGQSPTERQLLLRFETL